MIELTPTQRRALRAAAHHLNAVVSISQKGLTPTVLAEIDRCLKAHELIKVRLYDIERDERTVLCTAICTELQCAEVQHIGKLLVLWREDPERKAAEKSTLATRRNDGTPAATTPGGRRPRPPANKKQAAASLERRQRKTSH